MGRSDRTAQRDAEFTDYLAARQPALMRTAYLLTGDRHQAEDVLQTPVAKLYLAWDKVHDRNAVDAYVRRILANENNSLWRRGWKRREYAADELPEGAPHHDTYDDGAADELWRVVQSLPPTETGRFAPEGGFISQWALSEDGRLLFTAYDGARWHLFAMNPDGGTIEELTDPMKGTDADDPFVLIQQ